MLAALIMAITIVVIITVITEEMWGDWDKGEQTLSVWWEHTPQASGCSQMV